MQELRILRWCDVCNAENEGARVEAAERFMVAVGLPDGRRMTPRLVETCEQHGKPFREMRDLVEQVGILPKAKGKQQPEEPEPEPALIPRPAPEPEPEKTPGRSTQRSGVWARQRVACPVCEIDLRRDAIGAHLREVHGAKLVQPTKCPDCGNKITHGAGMSTHRTKVHGYNHIAELAKRARK